MFDLIGEFLGQSTRSGAGSQKGRAELGPPKGRAEGLGVFARSAAFAAIRFRFFGGHSWLTLLGELFACGGRLAVGSVALGEELGGDA